MQTKAWKLYIHHLRSQIPTSNVFNLLNVKRFGSKFWVYLLNLCMKSDKEKEMRNCAAFQNYFGDPWNALDFVIVVGSLLDIVAALVLVSGE